MRVSVIALWASLLPASIAAAQTGPEPVALAEPQGGRPVLTLDDIRGLAAEKAPDIAIAAEKVVQSEANLRRAWAAVLPSVNLNGSYTLTCSAGGHDALNCADRTASFVDPKQLEAQAALFNGVADVLTLLADQEPDPDKKQDLLDNAATLKEGASATKDAEGLAQPVVVQPASVFAGSLSIAMPLFNGRAFPLLWNAYDSVDLAGRARQQVKSALLYSTTRAYHAAVAAQKLVVIAERQVEAARKHKEATAVRVEAQTQPPLALSRAALDELRAESQLESARSAYDSAIGALGLVVGRSEAFDVVAPDEPVVAPAGSADDLAERALAARPDVAAERITLELARRSETDAWMMFAPSVNLVASAHATSFTSGFVRDPVTTTLAVTASVPLYDGGVRYAALKDSASKIREEQIRLRSLEDKVRAQVRGDVREIPVKERARDLAQEAVRVARTGQEQAEASFEAGVGTALDVSDTGLALFVAENDLARAELDLELAKASLAYAVGEPLR